MFKSLATALMLVCCFGARSGQTSSPNAVNISEEDAQQRRAALRAAVKTPSRHKPAGAPNFGPPQRQLTEPERQQMRQQLSQQTR